MSASGPEMGGVAVTRQVCSARPTTRELVLSTYPGACDVSISRRSRPEQPALAALSSASGDSASIGQAGEGVGGLVVAGPWVFFVNSDQAGYELWVMPAEVLRYQKLYLPVVASTCYLLRPDGQRGRLLELLAGQRLPASRWRRVGREAVQQGLALGHRKPRFKCYARR